MARYPKARWRPVVDKGNDPPIIPVGVILHVSGGESTSLFEYFDGPSGGVESQMYLNRAGEWEQYRDTTQEADANYRGNSWIGPDGRRYGFISVETQGGARGQWSPPMLAEIKDFLRWASTEHGFPLRRCPTVQPDSPAEGGVGYHVMFGAGAGTFSWSNAAGKVCPGRDRIRQFDHDLVPWMATAARTPDLEVPDMIRLRTAEDGAIYLAAPGVFAHLNGEENSSFEVAGIPLHQVNARQRDVIRNRLLNTNIAGEVRAGHLDAETLADTLTGLPGDTAQAVLTALKQRLES